MRREEVSVLPTVAWDGDAVVMIDQRRLPFEEVVLRATRRIVAGTAGGAQLTCGR